MAHRASRVAREIMRHFAQHPDSIDSLEGIARWRLAQQRLDAIVDETAVALEWLVRRGLLQRIDIAYGPALYRIADGAGSRTEDR